MMNYHVVTEINHYIFISKLDQRDTSENDVPFQRNSNKQSCKKLYGKEWRFGPVQSNVSAICYVSLTATMNDFSVTFLSVYVILNEVWGGTATVCRTVTPHFVVTTLDCTIFTVLLSILYMSWCRYVMVECTELAGEQQVTHTYIEKSTK